MTIPAVAKARQILTSTIAKYPLIALEGADDVTTSHAWLQATDGEVSPWHRMAWTIDDLIFFGWSLWGVVVGVVVGVIVGVVVFVGV